MSWQPLPPEVAEWMGMDDAGLPDVRLVESAESVEALANGEPARRGPLGFVRRLRRAA